MSRPLLILDVDGVLCPDSKGFDANCDVPVKQFCDKDRTAIKLFKARGWRIVFLSGDRHINEAYAKYCKVDFYHSKNAEGKLDKSVFLERFENIYKIEPRDMIFVGDDPIFDLPLMRRIITYGGRAFTPADGAIDDDEVPILARNGGNGVVWELYKMLFGSNYEIGEFGD